MWWENLKSGGLDPYSLELSSRSLLLLLLSNSISKDSNSVAGWIENIEQDFGGTKAQAASTWTTEIQFLFSRDEDKNQQLTTIQKAAWFLSFYLNNLYS